MKIATWNVNSLRKREDTVLDWLEAEDVDVLCLQETKVTDQEFPEDAFGDLGYDVCFHGQRTYNGVAIISRDEPEAVTMGLPGDPEDREARLIAATVAGTRVVNVYVPNGQALDSDKFRYKLRWLERLAAFMRQSIEQHARVVLCGDFNIAPEDRDVWDASEFSSSLFISEEERAHLGRVRDAGLSDAFRAVHAEAERPFTWWDYRGGGFERDRGMRIDHLYVSAGLRDHLVDVRVHRDQRGRPEPSDHVPVVLELAD